MKKRRFITLQPILAVSGDVNRRAVFAAAAGIMAPRNGSRRVSEIK
jgi:hypothetical protein